MGYTLFDGLRNVRSAQRAKIAELAAQYRLNKMKDDISLLVAQSYLQVILNKANLKALVSQNEVTKGQIKQTEDQVNAGVLPEGDIRKWKTRARGKRSRSCSARHDSLGGALTVGRC
jgi:outer membrane protein